MDKLFDISGRIILITGSSQGIGLSLARGFARNGAKVILNGRDPAKLQQVVGTLKDEGFDVTGYAFDVSNQAAVVETVDAIERDVGPIAVLVNNAGIHRRAPFETMSLSDWQTVMDTNLTSAFIVSQAVSRYMRSSAAKERSSISLRLMRKRPGRPLPIIAPLRAA